MTDQRRWGHRKTVVNFMDTGPFPLVLFIGMAFGAVLGIAIGVVGGMLG